VIYNSSSSWVWVENFVFRCPFPYTFKLIYDKVEVLPNDPSELVKQMSLMVEKKISDAQVAVGETLVRLNDEIAALKMGKSVEDNTYFSELNSAGTFAIPEQFYGMQPNSFPGQSPPPPSVHAPSARPIQGSG
jgi:hypothetical protein